MYITYVQLVFYYINLKYSFTKRICNKLSLKIFRICRKKSDRTFECKIVIVLPQVLYQHTKIRRCKLWTIYGITKFRNNCYCKTQGCDRGDNEIGVSVAWRCVTCQVAKKFREVTAVSIFR